MDPTKHVDIVVDKETYDMMREGTEPVGTKVDLDAPRPLPSGRGERLPRESTTVNNPRKMDKAARRMLRRRA